MINFLKRPLGAVAAVGVAAFAASAFAVDAAAPVTNPPATQPNTSTGTYPTQNVVHHAFRASQLVGLNVQNSQGETVGEIKDLVINPQTGRAHYVALSVGGFLGLGDKLFAIPYDAFTFAAEDHDAAADFAEADDADDRAVTPEGKLNDVVGLLNVSKEHFKNDQGFDQDHWPNFADPTWRTANEQAFQNVPRRQRTARADNDPHAVRASKLIGLNVDNASDEAVGEINDLMIDDSEGNVRYVALSVGGFLGLGDKLFAIPIKAFNISQDRDANVTATLPVTKESFDNVEGFDADHWPNSSDPNWRTRNDQAYLAWPNQSTQ